MTLSLTNLESLRQRRLAGEGIASLAAEAGVPWQTLYKSLKTFTVTGAEIMNATATEPAKVNGKPKAAEVFSLLAQAIEEHLTDRGIDEDSIRAIVASEVGKIAPRQVEVKLPDGTINKLGDQPHKQFTDLLEFIEEGHVNLMMVGPAGCGKTTLAKNVAQALGRDFGFISLSAGVTETHLMGRTLPQADGSWQYVPSLFVTMYEGGGVFLLDEVDAADANVMVAINAALANGCMVTPDGKVRTRHENTIIVAAANTWGRGADLMYVGRNQLDSATLDRFVGATAMVTYDADLELAIAKSMLGETDAERLTQWVWNLREKIVSNRLRRVASTRLIVSGAKALKVGRQFSKFQARYFQDWSADEKAKVC